MWRFFRRGHFVRKTALTATGVTAAYYVCAEALYGRTGLPTEAPSTLWFNAYRLLPLNVVSRCWGWCSSIHLRESIRKPVIGFYVRMFNCNLEEAEESELRNYSSLNDFFRRSLKAEARRVDEVSPLVSPCDGRVLHFGKIEDDKMEQIKGVLYGLKGFLGPCTSTSEDDKQSIQQQWIYRKDSSLYHCIIYLAPGDYHRFHSPADWEIKYRRYFPGYLLSVNPRIAVWINGLFSINERVVYYGEWKHGFFSFSAVGATNVGSINIVKDQNLKTNRSHHNMENNYEEIQFDSNSFIQTKGKLLGEFNLGSSIVLIFEAPKNFEFDVSSGDRVTMGQRLQKP